MWQYLLRKGLLRRTRRLTRDTAVQYISEDERIPDDPRRDLGDDETSARCPWGGPTEGDDKDSDFLMRDEWREQKFHNVELGLAQKNDNMKNI